jgi:hypothetical protein
LEFTKKGVELLPFVIFQRTLIGLDVTQQDDPPGLVVVQQTQKPFPDVLLLGGGHDIRTLAPRGAHAEEKVRYDQGLLLGEDHGAAAVEEDFIGKGEMHEASFPVSSIGTRQRGLAEARGHSD